MPVRSSQWRMPTVVDHPTHLIICHHQGGRKGVQVESQGAGVGGREGGREGVIICDCTDYMYRF